MKQIIINIDETEASVNIKSNNQNDYWAKGLTNKEDLKEIINIFIDDFIKDEDIRG